MALEHRHHQGGVGVGRLRTGKHARVGHQHDGQFRRVVQVGDEVGNAFDGVVVGAVAVYRERDVRGRQAVRGGSAGELCGVVLVMQHPRAVGEFLHQLQRRHVANTDEGGTAQGPGQPRCGSCGERRADGLSGQNGRDASRRSQFEQREPLVQQMRERCAQVSATADEHGIGPRHGSAHRHGRRVSGGSVEHRCQPGLSVAVIGRANPTVEANLAHGGGAVASPQSPRDPRQPQSPGIAAQCYLGERRSRHCLVADVVHVGVDVADEANSRVIAPTAVLPEQELDGAMAVAAASRLSSSNTWRRAAAPLAAASGGMVGDGTHERGRSVDIGIGPHRRRPGMVRSRYGPPPSDGAPGTRRRCS